MLVCHCNTVSERQIRKAVRGGALCPDAIARTCGAGGGCGGCRPVVAEIIEHELRESAGSPTEMPSALDGLLAPT